MLEVSALFEVCSAGGRTCRSQLFVSATVPLASAFVGGCAASVGLLLGGPPVLTCASWVSQVVRWM